MEGINEEINKVIIAVKESNVSPDKFIGYQEIGLHMFFISIWAIISKARIYKLKFKYWHRTHKYGIRIPKSVK